MEAYAKIVGTNFRFYIRTLNVTLGRDGVCPEFIDLGDDLSISRRQAEISWNGRCFIITNTGRNSIICNRMIVKNGESKELYDKTPVKIGKSCFYFLLPLEE